MLLSFPQKDQPNTVEVLKNGVVEYSMVGEINVSLKCFFFVPHTKYKIYIIHIGAALAVCWAIKLFPGGNNRPNIPIIDN